MEPSPLSDGNHGCVDCGGDRLRASMEPSPLSDGNAVEAAHACVENVLQWSRPLSATETRARTPTPRRAPGFNGAVASQRRKPRSLPRDLQRARASMEPSPLSDGNRASAAVPAGSAKGFNGAVASQRRKP